MNFTEGAVFVTALGAIVTPVMLKVLDGRQADRARQTADKVVEVKTVLEKNTQDSSQRLDVIHDLVNSRLTRAIDLNKLMSDFILRKFPDDPEARAFMTKSNET